MADSFVSKAPDTPQFVQILRAITNSQDFTVLTADAHRLGSSRRFLSGSQSARSVWNRYAVASR